MDNHHAETLVNSSAGEDGFDDRSCDPGSHSPQQQPPFETGMTCADALQSTHVPAATEANPQSPHSLLSRRPRLSEK
jgi:hypothetical protein